MKWTEIPSGELNAAEQRLRLALGDDAATVTTRLNIDPGFVTTVAGFMVKGGYEPTMSQQRAKEIMGINFFGVEEAVRHLRVKPRRFELAGFGEVVATDEELEKGRETHILAAVFPFSVLQIREAAKSGTFVSYGDAWYNAQAFASRKGQPSWWIVRKTAVPNSTSKTWNEQQALHGSQDETPTARVAVYTMTGHYLATGEKIFSDVWVRCSDLDSAGSRVYVRFIPEGVSVSAYEDGDRHGYLGVASARKFE